MKSSMMAWGSYGLGKTNDAGKHSQTMRVWFCGGKISKPPDHPLQNITSVPCAHLTREEARKCPNREKGRD